MKNLFCALAFMLMGTLAFASSEVVEQVADDAACFPVEFSCGATGTACGDDLGELIDLILFVDDLICD